MNTKLSALALLTLVAAFGCQKTNTSQTVTPPPVVNKIAPDGFTYLTTKQVSVNVRILAPDNTPIANVPVSFYKNNSVTENGNAPDSSAIYSCVTDKNGYAAGTAILPATADTLLIDAKNAGVVRNVKAYISGGSLNAVLGGTDGVSGNVTPGIANIPNFHLRRPGGANGGLGGTNYVSMGSTDNQGRPTYLVSPADVISNSFMTDLLTSLPESRDIRVTHPQYLNNGYTSNVIITKTSDVWITFTYEGAGYQNSVGWYTYPTGTPPSTTADIKTVNLMFPNASLYGSGGNMRTGDKVKIGTFQPGTTIGFVLFSNGWAGGNQVNTSGSYQFFTNSNLNPEPTAALQQHTIVLNDATTNRYLICWEDMLRTNPSCDHDFNDVCIYATANPVDGISNTNVAPIDTPVDTDGDGVTDVFDQYPTDPTRAYNTWYPSANSFATIAFEDNWPSKGDYDMNDLVVNYRYKIVSNAQNNVVELYGDFAVQAAGASFKNGFGVQFPFSPTVVKQITGQKFISNYIKLSSNGTEASQSKAVMIPFDNYNALINNPGGAYFINTQTSMPKVTGDTAHMYVQFTSPISASTLGTAPFNPFCIPNLTRGNETHLPGNLPTDLANTKYFGSQDDATNTTKGIYYVSTDNWPWAINFPGAYTYPIEGVNITKAYLHFLDWTGSSGTNYADWYSNSAAGYQNAGNLYNQ